ncbi:MAG: sodium:solute symporter family protein [Synergistaceae bacterium]|jgi:SSS family solute:Na+ symporter|nr:sodium:solute symporter family protein [Synergistaceae bacterium]
MEYFGQIIALLTGNGYVQAILGYAVLLILVGWFAGRRVKNSSGFFVAGRKLSGSLLFTTLIAANLGAGSTVGVAAIAYKSGISAWWWIGSAGVGSMILAFLVGPRIWRIACRHQLYTLGDYLDRRYSRTFRGLFSGMMAVGTLALFSGQLLGIAWILEVVAGVPKEAGVVAGAFVTTLYFAAGGLLSAAVVNVVEVGVILAGFLVALPFVWSFVGGWEGLVGKVSQNLTEASAQGDYFSMGGIGMTVIIGYLVMLIPSFFISPGLIGKVFGARSERAIKAGTAMNGVVQLVFAIIPVVIGMAAFASFPSLSRPDLALPTAMKEMMPFGIATLALAAIFAAEVSTADAVLYMLATSVSNDLYKTFLNPHIEDSALLRVSRLVTLVSGILGVVFALFLDSIISALTIFYSLMSVSLAAPLIFGLYTRRASNGGALLSSLLGVALTLFCTFYKGAPFVSLGVGTLDTATHLVDFGFTKLNATTCGILTTFVVMAVSLVILPSKAEKTDLTDFS